MALGKVASIDPNDSTIGTVIEDETGETYPYNDPNFKATGLQVGNPCMYDIDYSSGKPVATNLKAYTPKIIDITTPVKGPITVNPGETVNVKKGGMVNGSVSVNQGNLFIEDTGGVIGNIDINQQGNLAVRKGGMVNGSVSVNQGSACKIVNAGSVKGDITIVSASHLIIGNDNGGGIVTGAITITKIRKVIITATSTINCGK